MANEFDQLLACSWRGIEFPTTSVEVSFQQDLAEHKYYGVDGARVEATGRGPMSITAHIPLVNGIVPGKSESWGVLYPTGFRSIVRAAADRSVGVFKHPELDEITCRARSAEFRHSGDQRDGVTLVLHLIETVLEFDDGQLAVGNSPISNARLAALDLDQDLAAGNAVLAEALERGLLGGKMPFTVEDFFSHLAGAFDQVSIAQTRASGLVDRYRYHAERVGQSAMRARDARLWPTIESAEQLKSAINYLKEHPPVSRPVLTYAVKDDILLTMLLLELPSAKLGDVIQLNPRITAQPFVRAGTSVRYYAAA